MEEAAQPEDLGKPPSSSTNSTGDFDCNICLDLAREPVVTLCGHLYCCPCIDKWLLVEEVNVSPQSCPVCKASLSQDSLVHLSGRSRPTKRRQHQGALHPPEYGRRYGGGYGGEFLTSASSRPPLMGSIAGGVLWEMAVAAATTGRVYYTRPDHRDGNWGLGAWSSPRRRRQEMEAERCLNQIWSFMLCCAVLCLLLF